MSTESFGGNDLFMLDNKKKVLLIHRYFYPDSPPYALILEDMRQILSKQGYHVDVLSSQPSYKSIDKTKKIPFKTIASDGSIIYRLPVFRLNNTKIEKILNYFWFPIITFIFLLAHKKYHIITVSTAPQIFLAFFVSLITKLKKNKLIYHCMDIHPEIGRLSGEFKNKIIYYFLKKIDMITCKTASAIIVLSSDMKKALIDRAKYLEDKIFIINNYDISTKEIAPDSFFQENSSKKRIIYAGNIGRYQHLDSFILALREYGCIENIELIFVGEGHALNQLKHLAAPIKNCVRFIPHQSLSIARKIISEADMCIVSLQEGVIKYAYPSKTMTYLAEGIPILACVEKKSELAQFITTENLGIVVDHSEREEIYNFFKQLSQNNLSYRKEHIQNVFNKTFSKKQFEKKFTCLILTLMEEK